MWRQWWGSQRPTPEWAERYKVDRADGSLASEPVALSKEYLAKSRKRVVRQKLGLTAVSAGVVALIAASFFIKIKIEKTVKV